MLWSQDPQTLERALVVAQQAVALEDSLPGAHGVLAYAYLWNKQHEQALAAAKRAIAQAPNDAEGYADLGLILNFAGRPEEAIGLIEKTMRLNPRYPVPYLLKVDRMNEGLTRPTAMEAVPQPVADGSPFGFLDG
jgi:adenylate cyclase